MGNFCACIITTSPQIMPPKRALPIHTNSITQPLHTVHTGHVSATFGVGIYCVRWADAAPRGQHPLCSMMFQQNGVAVDSPLSPVSADVSKIHTLVFLFMRRWTALFCGSQHLQAPCLTYPLLGK